MTTLSDEQLFELLAEAKFVPAARPTSRSRIFYVSAKANFVTVQLGGNHPLRYVQTLLAMGCVEEALAHQLCDKYFG